MTNPLHNKIMREKVSFKERYYDSKSKRHKWRNVEGTIIGKDDAGNTLIETKDGIVQRTNFMKNPVFFENK